MKRFFAVALLGLSIFGLVEMDAKGIRVRQTVSKGRIQRSLSKPVNTK